MWHSSGERIVVAIAALAATLFRPPIKIYNLLKPLRCIRAVTCHYHKAIEILAVRWCEKLEVSLLRTTRKSVYQSFFFFSTQTEHFTAQLGRSENEARILYIYIYISLERHSMASTLQICFLRLCIGTKI